MTPQQRSREILTAQNFLVATVETRKDFPDRKQLACSLCGHQPMVANSQDLYGCFDLLAIHPQKQEIIFVQVTSYSNHAARRTKVLTAFESKLVLLAGCRIWIHSWWKDEKVNRWILRGEEITLDHFESAPHYPSSVREMLRVRRKAKAPDFPPGTTLPLSPDLGQEPF